MDDTPKVTPSKPKSNTAVDYALAESLGLSRDRLERLPAAAARALIEAAERKATEAAAAEAKAEKGGPKGPEPTRYGDWERNGRAVDFS